MPVKLNVITPNAGECDAVDMFWCVLATHAKRSFHELLPSACASLVFRWSGTDARLVLMGPNMEQATVEIDGSYNYFGARFKTGMVPKLIDVSHSDLLNGRFDVFSFGGTSVSALMSRFHGMNTAKEYAEAFIKRLRGLPPMVESERCRHACGVLESKNGHVRIEDLAATIGAHRRTVERMFHAHLGFSPKQTARLIRLHHAANNLRANPRMSPADVAYLCGYADQAHMYRDFKGLTGLIPGTISPGDDHRVTGQPRTRKVHRFGS